MKNQTPQATKQYDTELEGQNDFYSTYLPRIDNSKCIDDYQNDYTDGVINGNLLEFKLNISDLNAALFQAVKYLSAMRIKGESIPANIVLISLNVSKAYIYHSADYLEHIERVYSGGASKDNSGFVCSVTNQELNYGNMNDEESLITTLKSNHFTKIHIDENDIVGWAQRYYRENPSARKADFIGDYTSKVNVVGEIRQPDKFKEFIYPYTGESNERFRYLMDRLNDFLQKKNLGAFYTHPLYAEKSLELVREAIARVPEGNDYVIIDRCAGTGNLELGLTNEELSHTIVSTLEYYEYKVLLQTLGDKVRHIIPPTERTDTFNMGLVRGADALSEEYVKNAIIGRYVNDPKCTIIMFENPPYAETTSIEHQKRGEGKNSSVWKNSFVVQAMKKEIRGAGTNDLGNAFIWSAFKYYLRQPTDSYVVYSPVKYWKVQHLIDKKFLRGFAFNRRHFHTNIDATTMVALWSNEQEMALNKIYIDAVDIDTTKNMLVSYGNLPVEKIHKKFSEYYYDKRAIISDTNDGILSGLNGLEADDSIKRRIAPVYNSNIVGYMAVESSGFDNPDLLASLTVAGKYNGNGFYLRSDNYLEKLPMFAASRYITYNRQWTERGRIMKSADAAERYKKDVQTGKLNGFLLKCLLFTVLEPQNHMREFVGSDGRLYRNQLCFDTANGSTLASRDIQRMKMDADEQTLIEQWQMVLADGKSTDGYNHDLNYGLYQIKCELNTSHKDEAKGITIYDYPSLNGNIKTLAEMVKKYYNAQIVPTLLEYEFLK